MREVGRTSEDSKLLFIAMPAYTWLNIVKQSILDAHIFVPNETMKF